MTQADHDRAGAARPASEGAFVDDEVEVVPLPDEGVVRVRGELDADTVDEVRECLKSLAPEGTPRLVVDMAAVSGIDWNGLGVLIGVRERVRRHGGELVLRSPTPEAGQLLDRSGMRDLFTIEPDPKDHE